VGLSKSHSALTGSAEAPVGEGSFGTVERPTAQYYNPRSLSKRPTPTDFLIPGDYGLH
jgi:hypothetical protein